MANMGLAETLSRIETALPNSPIAVFGLGETEFVRSVFASTVVTQREIAEDKGDLIGVFSSRDNIRDVRQKISAHLRVAV